MNKLQNEKININNKKGITLIALPISTKCC